ncbi:(2Fe-2S)-binding protein [Sphingomonas sp. DBB INV C78]|uniref:aromatic ring-hydroxylating oxygenase subunit alpha n=1 Tax=Sphingomonas sp. DBB INV C78 TaxID=3349434 RepID=UPI0036D2735E
MGHDHAATDARTAPVAAFAVLDRMTKDELKAWRLAPIPDNPSAAERGAERLPYPYGWFVACYSDELPAGEARPMRFFGKELAAWRGEDGKARVIDAYCRHLGAHMGHGGKVHGNQLECPFHAWRYDETGVVNEIPYGKVIPPQAKRPCGGWPTAEANGFVWIWYHPEGKAPMWEVETFSEIGDADWTAYDRYEWLVHAPLQFMAENAADTAHFKYVHGTATYPDATLSFDGHLRNGLVLAKLGTPQGEIDGKIANGNFGPGQGWTRFSGISETLLMSGVTPVDKDLVRVRFAFTQPKAQAEGPMAGLARALIRDILKQFDQDKVIWDRQRFVERALICDGDGPIGDFRRWYYQFYAEWADGKPPVAA